MSYDGTVIIYCLLCEKEITRSLYVGIRTAICAECDLHHKNEAGWVKYRESLTKKIAAIPNAINEAVFGKEEPEPEPEEDAATLRRMNLKKTRKKKEKS